MDESWRMRMGSSMRTLPHRKSMAEGTTRHSFTSTTLDPEDFADVFGGPPRTLFSRKFSADYTSSSSFYAEVFRNRSSEFVSPPKRSGRVLPAFRIPARGEGFYGDVFAYRDGRMSRERSRPKSKSNSSSVLSSEEVSPLRPLDGDDVALSSFASKLRPINVPSRWNSATMTADDDDTRKQGLPTFHSNRSSYIDAQHMENESRDFSRSSYYGFSGRVSSPETISLEPNSFRSIKVSVDDLGINSPSSPASSLCQESETKSGLRSNIMQEQDEEQEEDEVMSSYVIEINSDYREGTGEAVSIDEAIAWAKEKFQAHSSSMQPEKDPSSSAADTEERPNANEFSDQEIAGNGTTHSEMGEQKNWTTEEGKDQSEEYKLQSEIKLLEESIRLWSAGKETNIRLLLSALHHILWSDSGWHMVPLTNLIECSHVKKVYQKARLCLHPDKLQQRGATPQQKYVAEKVFSILQDAWAAFISQDVFF